MTSRLVNVKIFKNTIGVSCLHCGRGATVTAFRKRTGSKLKLPVRYCAEHYQESEERTKL